MSYFEKPKRTRVEILTVENGYLVSIGYVVHNYDPQIYIAKKEELSKVVVEAAEVCEKQYQEAISKWEEKEKKTAEGFEWQPKKQPKEEKKKDN